MRPVWSVFLAVVVLPSLAAAADFRLTSPTVRDKGIIGNEHVFNGFGCTGNNTSPELRWERAPKGTKSFAVTVYDPDAPTGSGWWHWVIFNMPPETTSLPAGAGKPEGGGAPQGSVQSMTDFGQPGYGGPCPPPGSAHRYFFKLYALDAATNLKPRAMKQQLLDVLKPHLLGEADLVGRYKR